MKPVSSESISISSLVKTSLVFHSPPTNISLLSLTISLLSTTTLSPSSSLEPQTKRTKEDILFRIDGTLPTAFSKQLYHPTSLSPGAAIPSPILSAFYRKPLRRLEKFERITLERISRLASCERMRSTTNSEGPLEVGCVMRVVLEYRDEKGKRGKIVFVEEGLSIYSVRPSSLIPH